MREEPPRRSMWGGGVDFPSQGQTLGPSLSQRRVSTGKRWLTWLLLAKGMEWGSMWPYLGAGRPGLDSLGPFGAGSPSGRRWRQLGKRRGWGRLGGTTLSYLPTPQSQGTLQSRFTREDLPSLVKSTPLALNENSEVGSHVPKTLSRTQAPASAIASTHTGCPPFLILAGPDPSDTYCHRAGALALPETGNRGDLGPPLLTCDSWIHTERHRVGSWALLENLLKKMGLLC